ncbi:MAG TPA: PH domain-containing protein [Lapillicoccus sp.]|nr:PH domain-containing protein [Lapillicoccus sp.]
MGFPENVLTSGEKVEKSLHPHWRTVVSPFLIGAILIAVSIYVAYLTPDDTQGNWIQWITVGIAVLIAIPLVIIPLMAWRTTHYVITTHRVMVRKGIISKSGKDITLSKITDVSFSQTGLDRMLGSGTLSIESAGDSPNEAFEAIPRSDRVQQLLNHLIDQDANRRAQRMVNRAGFETEAETADRLHEEEQRMHEEEERLAKERRAGKESGESGRESGEETTPTPASESER